MAFGTFAAHGEDDSGSSYPLKGQRLLRLLLITISCIICSGVTFGGGLLAQLFVRAGVGSWLCDFGEEVCDKQFLFVSQAFNAATGVAYLPLILAGVIYDRTGGKVLSGTSASLVALGLLVLQVPLLGAKHGYDEHTSGLLVWGFVIAGTGSVMSTFTPMTMAWHLFDFQTLVAAAASSTTTVPALLPVLMSAVMHWTGASLSAAIWVWFFLAVLAGFCLHFFVPALSEYRAEAEKVLCTALPPADRDSVWKILKDSLVVLRTNWPLHLLFVSVFAADATVQGLYASLLGDWGMMLFGSGAAGEKLGTIMNLIVGALGITLAPLLAYVSDNLEHGTPLWLAGMIVTIFVASVTLGLTAWSMQIATCAAFALFQVFSTTMFTKYVLAFSGPTLFGTVYCLFSTLWSLGFLAMQTLDFGWISVLPASGALHLRLPLQASCILEAILCAAWASRVLYTGLPEEPVVLAEDAESLPLLPPLKV